MWYDCRNLFEIRDAREKENRHRHRGIGGDTTFDLEARLQVSVYDLTAAGHLTAKGYEILTAQITPVLEALLGK